MQNHSEFQLALGVGPDHDPGGEKLGGVWIRAESCFLACRLENRAKKEAKTALCMSAGGYFSFLSLSLPLFPLTLVLVFHSPLPLPLLKRHLIGWRTENWYSAVKSSVFCQGKGRVCVYLDVVVTVIQDHSQASLGEFESAQSLPCSIIHSVALSKPLEFSASICWMPSFRLFMLAFINEHLIHILNYFSSAYRVGSYSVSKNNTLLATK